LRFATASVRSVISRTGLSEVLHSLATMGGVLVKGVVLGSDTSEMSSRMADSPFEKVGTHSSGMVLTEMN